MLVFKAKSAQRGKKSKTDYQSHGAYMTGDGEHLGLRQRMLRGGHLDKTTLKSEARGRQTTVAEMGLFVEKYFLVLGVTSRYLA
jgi:hypothetical protein